MSGKPESSTIALQADGEEHALSPQAPGMVVVTRWIGRHVLETMLSSRSLCSIAPRSSRGQAMSQLLRFPGSVRRDPAVDAWLHEHRGELGTIAQRWFEVLRGCGDDVRELLHDGHPTACVGDAAFAYVNAFTAHVNVGFFRGAEIPDPRRLLGGTGKFMRHVKLRPGSDVDAMALMTLIETAYADMKRRVG